VLDILLRLLSTREGREDLQVGYLGPLFGVVEIVGLGPATKDQDQWPSSILEVLYEASESSDAGAWGNHDQWGFDRAWKSEGALLQPHRNWVSLLSTLPAEPI